MNRAAFIFGLAIAAFFLFVVIPLSSRPAQAQQQVCELRSTVVARLAANYGEVPVARAITGGAVLEVLAAPNGATWTIIISYPTGLACVAAIGEGWQALAPPQGQPMRWRPVVHGADWISI